MLHGSEQCDYKCVPSDTCLYKEQITTKTITHIRCLKITIHLFFWLSARNFQNIAKLFEVPVINNCFSFDIWGRQLYLFDLQEACDINKKVSE